MAPLEEQRGVVNRDDCQGVVASESFHLFQSIQPSFVGSPICFRPYPKPYKMEKTHKHTTTPVVVKPFCIVVRNQYLISVHVPCGNSS